TSLGAPVRSPSHSIACQTYGAVAMPRPQDIAHMIQRRRRLGSRSRNSCARNCTRNWVRSASPRGRGTAMPRKVRSESWVCCEIWAQAVHSCRCAASQFCSALEIPSTRSCAMSVSARACRLPVMLCLPALRRGALRGRDKAATLQWKAERTERRQFLRGRVLLENGERGLHGRRWECDRAKRERQFFVRRSGQDATAKVDFGPQTPWAHLLPGRSARRGSGLSSGAASR